jgi:hypothetical protein
MHYLLLFIKNNFALVERYDFSYSQSVAIRTADVHKSSRRYRRRYGAVYSSSRRASTAIRFPRESTETLN